MKVKIAVSYLKVKHKSECEQLTINSDKMSDEKILTEDFFGSGRLYLFERDWFRLLLGGSRLPNADGSAGATSDNQLRVWAYGTKDLTPFWQTLVHHQCLKTVIRLEVIKLEDKRKDRFFISIQDRIEKVLKLMLSSCIFMMATPTKQSSESSLQELVFVNSVYSYFLLNTKEFVQVARSSIGKCLLAVFMTINIPTSWLDSDTVHFTDKTNC